MKIKKLLNKSVSVFLILLFFCSFVGVDNAKAAEVRITLNRDTFESTMSQLLLSGDAEFSDNKVYLSGVTHDIGPQSGALFFSDKVDLGANNSFSTFFVFSLENRTIQAGSWVDRNFTGFDREQATGADGIAFIVASGKNQVGNVGADLGYGGIGNSVCIEFDTYCNTDHSDPTYNDNPDGAFNHIAMHVNGDMSQHYPNNSVIAMGEDYFDNENPFYVWVDYDGTTLKVYIAQTTTRPAFPVLTQTIDLRDYTSSDQVYVGFSAAHGQGTQQHVLSQWNFDNIYHNGGLSSIPGTYKQAPAGVEASLSGDDVAIQLKNSDGSNNTTADVVVEFFDSNNVKINSNEIRTDANGQATCDTAGKYGDIKVVIEGGAYDTVNKLLTEYNITYHLNGGTNNGSNPATYNIISETIRFADPAKSGYNFGGWFIDAGCTSGNEISEIVSGSTGNVEVWAKWTANGETAYKVEHYQQDVTGEGYTLAETDNLTGTTDTVVSAVAKNYPGFSENTSHGSRIASGTIAADGSLVLKLYYDRNTCTVTFKDWDGTDKKTEQVRYSGAATAPADPSRAGYKFTGWDVNFSNVTGDLIVTAEYSINQYTVSFNSNGGSPVDSETANYNTLLSEPTPPTKADYDFSGWYKEAELKNKWEFGTYTIPANNITLYAKWVPSQDSITMVASPNTVEAGDSFNQIFTLNINNDTVTGSVYESDINLTGVFSNLSIGEISNDDITVTTAVYGNLDSAGTGIITLNQDKLLNRTSPLSADIIVTARPTYVVSYDKNGANSGSVPTDNNSYEEGDTVIIESNAGNLTKNGYTFAGWNTKTDGSGDSYKAEDTLTMDNSNLTLYAQWTRTIVEQYSVTFNSNGGSSVANKNVAYNTKIKEPSRPSRGGYNFKGWYEDEALTKAFDFNTPIVKNITLYAKWSKKESSSSDSSGGKSRSNKQEDTIVIVNGEKEKAGEEQVQEEAGEKIVEVKVKAEAINNKIEEIINKQSQEIDKEKVNIVEIPVTTQDAKQVSTKLTGDLVKKMDENGFKLSIKTNDISYVMSAKEVGIESVAQNLGIQADKLKEIEVEVDIDKVDNALAKKIEESAKAKDYEVVFPPVNFEILAKTKINTREEKEVKVSKFKQYVQREMKIPAGVAPNKITTGIVYNSDGTFSHIPTTVLEKEGRWYAKLNSLTNSSYSVIWNPIKVKTVENHWSKVAVNDMASRLVIKNPEEFNPDVKITRGEFAEYITKALGIYRTGIANEDKFTDVHVTDDLADAIEIAVEYGIIKGYPDGSFKPDNQISREEAMAMYARAMDIVGLKKADNNRIENYTDRQEVADWAYASVRKTIGARVFNGRTIDTIAPKGTFTYAEAATAIRNLLIVSGLINK